MKLKTAVKNLHEGWKFRQARLTNWYPATVPGVVHTDLLQNKIIEDPFFRLNERGLQWIDKEDWVYETCFTLAADMMRKENMELVFEGLDTYADVYLNDECILKADNMFRRWSIPVRQYIREENNILKVYFHSPVKIDVPKWDALPYQYPASNDQSENGGLFNKKISIFARKAGYHYGWDWGPRLVTSGIWRPVYIRAWSDLRINDVFIEQKEVGAGRAVIAGHVELDADKDMDGVLVTITDEATGRVLGEWQADLKRGTNRVTVDFVLHKPKLWWSNGLGEPFLYRFRTDIIAGGELLDSKTERVGIRSLKVVHQPDKDGHTFYIELNGRPVFAKGANYIPSDNFLPRVTPENYKRTILDAAGVNMNMLRVWGGGIYENDVFYDLCDEHGIMIWQDFMFACSMYPAEGALLDNIHQEAVDNVKRLRNHACIALWCGNNECQDAWLGWGWKCEIERQNKEYADKIWAQYRLQLQVCRFDGTVVYHWDKSVGISGNDSRVCFSAPLAKLLEGADRGTVYVRVDYTDKSGRVYHNNYCLDKQKNMNYPKVDLQTEVRSIEGGYEVTVSTDKFARAVCLSVADNESVYSDNYFDVQPKSSVQVQVRTRLSAEAFNASLRLTCLNNEF